MARDRINVPVAGAMRSGKTYFSSKKLARNYKGTVVAYNVGKEKDFPASEYITIKPLSIKEHLQLVYKDKNKAKMYSRNPTIEYFFLGNEIYHFKFFNEKFRGRNVRIFRRFKNLQEALLLKAFFLYLSNCLIILDDCKVVFKRGIMDEATEFFNRCNHAGSLANLPSDRSKGIDIITIWHSCDHINEELLDYITAIILFNSNMIPNLKKFGNIELENEIEKGLNKLKRLSMKDSTKYARCEIRIKDVDKYKGKIFLKHQ